MTIDSYWDIGYTQHRGKLRPTQQDALWNGQFLVQTKHGPTRGLVFDCADPVTLVVSDGVSSSPSPELASAFVAQAIGELPRDKGFGAPMLRAVHRQLCDGYARGPTHDTATTVVAVSMRGRHCQVVNVGDSRCYRITGNGQWTQISRDHSYVSQLRDEGYLVGLDEDASLYDQVTEYIIANQDEDQFAIHSAEVFLDQGDTLLLCSDGVHDVLHERDLKQLYNPQCSTVDQAEIWRRALMAAGAPDNFSIILVRLKGRANI
jgi:serine/threonine protein phosphatase PrpC